MEELFADPDPKRAERAMQAMLGMRKLDIAAQRGGRRAGGVTGARDDRTGSGTPSSGRPTPNLPQRRGAGRRTKVH